MSTLRTQLAAALAGKNPPHEGWDDLVMSVWALRTVLRDAIDPPRPDEAGVEARVAVARGAFKCATERGLKALNTHPQPQETTCTPST